MVNISRSKTSAAQKKVADFNDKALNYLPPWAWAFCAIILALSLSIRQIGLDVTTPLNRIMTAYAVRIEVEANQSNELSKENIKRLERRIEALEKKSHLPAKNER